MAKGNKKNTTPESTEPAPAAEETGGDRRSRGLLEEDIKRVTDKIVSGQIQLPEGTNATPHRLANLLKDEDSLDKAPSTGAVSNILTRWAKYGFALINEKPLYFKNYSAKGQKEGLDALREKFQASAKEARRAERQANQPAAPAKKAPAKKAAAKKAAATPAA